MTEEAMLQSQTVKELKQAQEKQAALSLACAALLSSLPETAKVDLSRLDQILASLRASGEDVGAAEGEAKKAAAHIVQTARRHLGSQR